MKRSKLTHAEALKRVIDFEAYVTKKWPEFSELMRDVLLASRNRFIKELQAIQLKEFDRS